MVKSRSSKRPKKSNALTSQPQTCFLSQLEQLRNFIKSSNIRVSESVLCSTLRKHSYNVEQAAEDILISGYNNVVVAGDGDDDDDDDDSNVKQVVSIFLKNKSKDACDTDVIDLVDDDHDEAVKKKEDVFDLCEQDRKVSAVVMSPRKRKLDNTILSLSSCPEENAKVGDVDETKLRVDSENDKVSSLSAGTAYVKNDVNDNHDHGIKENKLEEITRAKLEESIENSSSHDASTSSLVVRPYRGGKLLLCSRWVTGLSTSRNGKVEYQEELAVRPESFNSMNKSILKKRKKNLAPIVRFTGRNVEGTLPRGLCIMLAPLLVSISLEDQDDCNFGIGKSALVSVSAYALCEESGLKISSEIPLRLDVYIERPVEFFQMFSTSTPSSTNEFFGESLRGRGAKTSKSNYLLSPVEAAYNLLDWSEFGESKLSIMLEEFAKKAEKTRNEECNSQSQDNDIRSAVMLSEDDFKPEEIDEEIKAPSWTDDLLSTKGSVENEISLKPEDDPSVFREKGIKLHCYQREAMAWMLKREMLDDASESSEELELLAELARESLPSGKHRVKAYSPLFRHENESSKENICCECGPILASKEYFNHYPTLAGKQCIHKHPLWQRRLLASPKLDYAHSFFVNDLLGVATMDPPNAPRSCRGGLLADAMGLGKTVMILSLLLKSKELQIEGCEKYKSTENGSTLIVTPLSLMPQWEEEVKSKTNLSCSLFYGDSRGCVDFDMYDVVITSYGTVQSSGNAKAVSAKLSQHRWERIVLDEAHCIRNTNTIVSQACCNLQATERWCVTGTPLQNSLNDVYGLLKFLRHEPWCEASFWKIAVSSPLTQAHSIIKDNEKEKVTAIQTVHDRVKRLLAPIMIRRTRNTKKSDGSVILELPPIESETITVKFTDGERAFYSSLLLRSQAIFDGYVRNGTASRSLIQIFSLLQKLRQACDHLALTVAPRITDMKAISRKMPNFRTSESVKQDTCKRVPKNFLNDLLDKFVSPSKKSLLSAYSQQIALSFNNSISQNKCIEQECPICLDCPSVEDAVLTPCSHSFCRDCLVPILRDQAFKNKKRTSKCEGNCPICHKFTKEDQLIGFRKTESGDLESYFLTPKASCAQSLNGVEDEDDTYLARGALEAALSGHTSSKLEAVISEMERIWAKEPGSKILIFSQYLGFLDLLNIALPPMNVVTYRLDGSMDTKRRFNAVRDFSNRDRKNEKGAVMLMSMKAGGVGLNLIAASVVFLVDPWWNAAFEDQCIHRVHRIGQVAEVVRVRRFVVEDSVEGRIIKLQERKKDVAKDILNDNQDDDGSFEGEGGVKPTLANFAELFGRAL